MAEPYWPYTTPGSKRELAETFRKSIAEYGNMFGYDPEFWDALAVLQEQDRIGEWKATLKTWQETKPHPRDLLDGA